MRLIKAHYVAMRVDQDTRPDLANRYEDYGWPATVVFDGAGQEIVAPAGLHPAAAHAGAAEGDRRGPDARTVRDRGHRQPAARRADSPAP